MKRPSTRAGMILAVLSLICVSVLSYFVLPRLWADTAPIVLKLMISGSLLGLGASTFYFALLLMRE